MKLLAYKKLTTLTNYNMENLKTTEIFALLVVLDKESVNNHKGYNDKFKEWFNSAYDKLEAEHLEAIEALHKEIKETTC